MKNNMKISFSLVSLVAASLTANASDVIADGGFEGVTAANGTLPASWTGAGGSWGTADSSVLGANDGVNRAFTGDLTSTLSQLTSAVALEGDIVTLDFYGNAANNAPGRIWSGTVFLDGGSGTKVDLGTIDLTMDTTQGSWQQANIAATSFTVTSANLITAGAGATYGVEFIQTGSSGFVGLDSVSLTIVPEPGSYALLAGLTGLVWVMVRRRK